jgi:hypothetical protein
VTLDILPKEACGWSQQQAMPLACFLLPPAFEPWQQRRIFSKWWNIVLFGACILQHASRCGSTLKALFQIRVTAQ